MVYLDNAATTYPKPEEVYKRVDYANRKLAFNAGRGSYKKAKEVAKIIEDTRKTLAGFVNEQNYNNVIFSTSSTEALNRIIFGIEWKEGDNVYISPFEHNSIVRPLEKIRELYNINIRIIEFDSNTWDVSDELENIFAIHKPKYIFMSSKSNVCGLKLPYKKVFSMGKKYSSINILDASQSFGIERQIKGIDTDFIVFAGHKSLYSTFGVAGFIITGDYKLKTTIFGGTGSDSLNPKMPEDLPGSYEAGSKNAVAIIGLNESCKWLTRTDVEKKEIELTNYLYDKIKNIKNVICYLPEEKEKCVGILSINVKNYLADEVGKILDEEFEICVRTGYHCSPYIHDFLGTKDFGGTVRISLNYFNTIEDIDKLIEALKTF